MPVTLVIGVSVVIIFLLYTTSVVKSIPCGKGFMDTFMSNFVHVDLYHLLANVYALYTLSRVEVGLGSKKFFSLIVFILILNTLIEVIAKKVFPSMKCSIGFSGVLFGVLAYELITKSRDINKIQIIIAIVVMVAGSSMNSKVSLEGHLIGAVSGIIGGFVFKELDSQ